jgi:hypothetical protein
VTPVLRLPRHGWAVGSTAVVMAVFFLVLWTFPTDQPGSVTLLSSEFLREYGYAQGSYDQRSAHLYAVVATAILSVLAFVATSHHWIAASERRIPPVNIWICLLATLLALALYQWLVPGWFNFVALVLSASFFLLLFIAPQLPPHTVEAFALLIIGGYIAVLIVPGLVTTPIPLLGSDPNSLAQVELHLNSLTQPGTDIAAGQDFFDQIPYGYGLLMPSIMSVIDHRLGHISVGGQIRFVQWCQVVFALTAAAGYLCCRPRAPRGAAARRSVLGDCRAR